MLDSFESGANTNIQGDFNSNLHISALCEGGRIKLRMHNGFNYKKGWAAIVEEFIVTVKKLPIRLDWITTDFGHLEISFECYEKTQEVRVWRAINKAKNMSKTTCMYCGNLGVKQVRNDNLIVICGCCRRNEDDSMVTGTWLDRF